jgi:NAD(P)H-flavin reductase
MTVSMLPSRYRVIARDQETHDTVTLAMRPMDAPIPAFRPGQFTMLYAFGVGEVPVSVSGTDSADGSGLLTQTVRVVGAVTRALCAAGPGQVIGVRGPYGTDWGVAQAAGKDLVVVAGGVGLAPLRPVVLAALEARARYGRIVLLVGARSPTDLLFTREFDLWRRYGVVVEITIDLPASGWHGNVGFVSELIGRTEFDPANTVAFVCGPEVMMRVSARALLRHGVAAGDIQVSLERNMRCGVATCGHCQLGPLLVCRDGPVVSYQRAAPLFAIREL